MDFELNYKHLTPEEHRGDSGPHRNYITDLFYKIELQQKLERILTRDYYNIRDLTIILGLKEKQANRAFRKLLRVNGISRDDVIFRLMGDKLYSWKELNTPEEIMEFIKEYYVKPSEKVGT